MNVIKRWLLKRAMAKEVIQEGRAGRIEDLYSLIREVCREEFSEDSIPSLESFLRDRFESTQSSFQVTAEGGKKKMPWAGRLRHARELCDDWGYVRDESGALIIRVNLPTHDETVLNEHRRNKTDQTQERVDAILEALNTDR